MSEREGSGARLQRTPPRELPALLLLLRRLRRRPAAAALRRLQRRRRRRQRQLHRRHSDLRHQARDHGQRCRAVEPLGDELPLEGLHHPLQPRRLRLRGDNGGKKGPKQAGERNKRHCVGRGDSDARLLRRRDIIKCAWCWRNKRREDPAGVKRKSRRAWLAARLPVRASSRAPSTVAAARSGAGAEGSCSSSCSSAAPEALAAAAAAAAVAVAAAVAARAACEIGRSAISASSSPFSSDADRKSCASQRPTPVVEARDRTALPAPEAYPSSPATPVDPSAPSSPSPAGRAAAPAPLGPPLEGDCDCDCNCDCDREWEGEGPAAAAAAGRPCWTASCTARERTSADREFTAPCICETFACRLCGPHGRGEARGGVRVACQVLHAVVEFRHGTRARSQPSAFGLRAFVTRARSRLTHAAGARQEQPQVTSAPPRSFTRAPRSSPTPPSAPP